MDEASSDIRDSSCHANIWDMSWETLNEHSGAICKACLCPWVWVMVSNIYRLLWNVDWVIFLKDVNILPDVVKIGILLVKDLQRRLKFRYKCAFSRIARIFLDIWWRIICLHMESFALKCLHTRSEWTGNTLIDYLSLQHKKKTIRETGGFSCVTPSLLGG